MRGLAALFALDKPAKHKIGVTLRGDRMRLSRRTVLLSGLGVATAQTRPARAADAVSVGVLRFVSSAGLFLAQEMGFFRDAGITATFVYFDAAQPVAVALASGDTGLGATAITGGTLNLAAKGVLKVVASQGAERKGYKGSALLVSRAAFDRGITSLAKLPGASVAITQVGSSQHYMLGQIAAAAGFDIKALTIRPLQSIANMIATIRSGQVDATILTPQFSRAMLERGEVHVLAQLSDVSDYQYGALFASAKLAASSPDLTRRFVGAYQKGAAAYADALLRRDEKGDFVADDQARAAARLLAPYIYPADHSEAAIDNVLAAVVFVDREGRVDPADIDRQIGWYQEQKLVVPGLQASSFVDKSFGG